MYVIYTYVSMLYESIILFIADTDRSFRQCPSTIYNELFLWNAVMFTLSLLVCKKQLQVSPKQICSIIQCLPAACATAWTAWGETTGCTPAKATCMETQPLQIYQHPAGLSQRLVSFLGRCCGVSQNTGAWASSCTTAFGDSIFGGAWSCMSWYDTNR